MKVIVTLLLGIMFILSSANAQEAKQIQFNDLYAESVKTEFLGLQSKVVFWLPPELFEYLFSQVKHPKDQIDKAMDTLKKYMIFLVVEAKTEVSPLSSTTTFKSDEQVRKTIKLIDSSNKSFSPFNIDELSSEMTGFVNAMKPNLVKVLGEMGKGSNIYVFKNKVANGSSQGYSIRDKNSFTISFDSTKFSWKLPFVCTLPDLFCPVDKEKMKGNWIYCPIHGVNLSK